MPYAFPFKSIATNSLLDLPLQYTLIAGAHCSCLSMCFMVGKPSIASNAHPTLALTPAPLVHCMHSLPSRSSNVAPILGPAGHKGHEGSAIWWAYLQHGWGRGRRRGYPPICCLRGQQKGPCPTGQVFTGMPSNHTSPVLHAVSLVLQS